MISILNYGIGNVKAFSNIYKCLNFDVQIASTKSELNNSSKIIFPGVGSFDWAMQKLEESDLRTTLENKVKSEKIPVLGICIGMQMMANKSQEGKFKGLGWINSEIVHFSKKYDMSAFPLPHMGWNTVISKENSKLFKNLQKAKFYFLHSYHAICKDERNITSFSNYNFNFAASFEEENIFGVQFHPEKSHKAGIQLLKNFGEL